MIDAAVGSPLGPGVYLMVSIPSTISEMVFALPVESVIFVSGVR